MDRKQMDERYEPKVLRSYCGGKVIVKKRKDYGYKQFLRSYGEDAWINAVVKKFDWKMAILSIVMFALTGVAFAEGRIGIGIFSSVMAVVYLILAYYD
jgi:hypothetical protein